MTSARETVPFRDRFRRMRRRWRRDFQSAVSSVPFFILRVLPRRWALSMGRMLADGAYALLSRDRQRAISRMEVALSAHYSASEIPGILRASYRNLGMSLVEVIRMPGLRTERFTDFIDASGEENLHRAWLEHRGVILMTGHIGNWEYLAGYIAQRGYPLTVLAKDNVVPGFDSLLTRIRMAGGYRPLVRGTLSSAKESLRVLRRGELLGLLIDQDTKVDGVFVDFFGKQAWTPVGAATLAMKSGAPVIFIWIQRMADNRHRVSFSPPITFPRTDDKIHDQIQMTAEMTKIIEHVIAVHPDHWVWMHDRWKTRPPRES